MCAQLTRDLFAIAKFLCIISYFGFGFTSAYNSILFCCLRRNVEPTVTACSTLRLILGYPLSTKNPAAKCDILKYSATITDCKARYLLRIEILTCPTCIRHPITGVPVGILLWRLVWKARMMWRCLYVCVCETICLSDTFVHSAKTNKHTFTFFSPQMGPHTKQSYFSWEILVSIYYCSFSLLAFVDILRCTLSLEKPVPTTTTTTTGLLSLSV